MTCHGDSDGKDPGKGSGGCLRLSELFATAEYDRIFGGSQHSAREIIAEYA